MFKIIKIILLCIFLLGTTELSVANLLNKKSLNLQKAYTIGNHNLIYTRPSFDSKQIVILPAGKLVTISRKLHFPKNEFGSFYHIYITKPKKIRAYISEIDVSAHYLPSSDKKNPAFKIATKKIKHIKSHSQQTLNPEKYVKLSEPSMATMRFIGPTVSFKNPLKGLNFGVKLNSLLPLPIALIKFDVDISIPPIMENYFMLKTDILIKKNIADTPWFLIYVGAGLATSFKIGYKSFMFSFPRINIVGAIGAPIKISKKIFFLTEVKIYSAFKGADSINFMLLMGLLFPF